MRHAVARQLRCRVDSKQGTCVRTCFRMFSTGLQDCAHLETCRALLMRSRLFRRCECAEELVLQGVFHHDPLRSTSVDFRLVGQR